MLDNLYTTAVTIQSGDSIPEHDTELTDIITNLDSTKYKSYWLYWIDWNQFSLPGNFKSFYFDIDSDTLSAIVITPPQNMAATYLSRRYNQTIPTISHYQTTDYLVGQSGFTDLTQLSANCRFYNNYCILKSAAQLVVPTQHFPFVIFAEGDYINSCYNGEPNSQQFTPQQFYDFLMNGADLTFTISGWHNKGTNSFLFDPVEFTISAEDFMGNNICTVVKNIVENEQVNTYRFTIFIGDYGIEPSRDINVLGALSSYTTPTPCLLINENGTTHLRAAAGGSLVINPSTASNNYFRYNLQTNAISGNPYLTGQIDEDIYTYAGGLEFSVEKEYLERMGDYTFQTFGNALIYKGLGNTFFRIYRPIPLEEIQSHITLYNRFIVDDSEITTIEFDFTDEYGVPYIDEENMTMDELHIGDYETIGEDLRPWQEGYFNQSDLDPDEDIPDYKPPTPPSGGTDEDEGSINLNPLSNLGYMGGFTTSYVLNSQAIRTIGESLWSNLNNDNRLTLKNFFTLVAGSGETDYGLTLSEIISYFISLKFFPFSLADVSTPALEQAIRVGTGLTPISTGTFYPKKLTEPYIKLDGGEVKIPEKWYNYLDLEPHTTCTVYVPYCGTANLPLSIISGATLKLTYCVDLITGGMTAAIEKIGNERFPIVSLNGSCGFDLLMTGTNGNAQQTNAMTNLASKTVNWTGDIIGAGVNGIMNYATGGDESGFGALSSMMGTVGNVAQDALQTNIQQPSIYATMPMTMGASTTLSGLLLPQKAYIQIRRHNPYRYDTTLKYDEIAPLTGFRSYFYGPVGQANGMGFVKCENVELDAVAAAGATEKELELIRQKLLSGIYT